MKRAIGIGLAAQVFLFQIFLVTKFRPLYFVLRVVFLIGLAAGVILLVRRVRRQKVLGLALLLVVLVRVPFYFHADGMVTTSDNAVDALAAVEIRDARTAPFFLLDAVKHMGTIKQLWVAFLWDIAGQNDYLFYLLIQLTVFIGFLLAWDAFLAESVPRSARLLLLGLNFAFVEAVLDYSLSIRGAPYLEMAMFFLLGAALFDPTFRDKVRMVLSYFFMFFAIYIHPLAAVLAGSFALCAAIYALAGRKFWINLAAGAVGGVAGLFHWFYYLAFVPKPIATGAWEDVGLLPFSLITRGWLPEYARALKKTFVNIFDMELSYLVGILSREPIRSIERVLDGAMILIGLFSLFGALVLALKAWWPVVRRRRALEAKLFPSLFFLVLFAAVAAKIFLFFPPHVEPRHNFDAVLLVVLSLYLTMEWFFRRRAPVWKSVGILILGAILSAPHVAAFYEQAVSKERSYLELLAVLRQNKVKIVDTDFILAYCVYYLSGRQIKATDLLGPFRVKNFYPKIRDEIDALPVGRRTFVFFSESYPALDWHKRDTAFLNAHVQNRFRRLGVPFTVHRLKDYTVIIPRREDRTLH